MDASVSDSNCIFRYVLRRFAAHQEEAEAARLHKFIRRPSLQRLSDASLTISLLLLALFWIFTTTVILLGEGWFKLVGGDFGCFWSATKAFLGTGSAPLLTI